MSEEINLAQFVQEKVDTDADFQATLADLSDEDKETALAAKRDEIITSELKALKQIAKDQKIRAEKAEKLVKEKEVVEKKDDLSSKDIIALTRAQVHDDDIEEVVEYAKFKGVSVAEALKSPVVQATIKTNEEHRKTANATNTSTARPSQKQVTDAQLLADASQGKVPAKGTEEAERLFWARRGGKRE